MLTKIKSKWVKALRSGRYKQANSVLLDRDGAYCCLGVLAKIQGVPKEELFCKMTSNLPQGKNAGLRRTSRDLLARMNDEGKTFKEIAAYIARRY
jgi:hypothetical protein